MTTKTRIQAPVSSLVRKMKTLVKYLSDGVIRIFKPTEDNYPETGVQPFEGDIADKKRDFD